MRHGCRLSYIIYQSQLHEHRGKDVCCSRTYTLGQTFRGPWEDRAHPHVKMAERPLISTCSRLTQGRRQQDGSLEEGESNGPVRNDVCKRRRKAPSVVQAHQPHEEEMGAGLKCRDLIYTIHILSLSQSRALHSAPEGINTICSGFSTLANS